MKGREDQRGELDSRAVGLTEALAGATTPQPAGRGVGEGGAGLASSRTVGTRHFITRLSLLWHVCDVPS